MFSFLGHYFESSWYLVTKIWSYIAELLTSDLIIKAFWEFWVGRDTRKKQLLKTWLVVIEIKLYSYTHKVRGDKILGRPESLMDQPEWEVQLLDVFYTEMVLLGTNQSATVSQRHHLHTHLLHPPHNGMLARG